MNKKGVIIGVIAIAVIAGIAASFSSSTTETVNLDMERNHGSISTAMGSPILGDPDAPITIVEFGDYQCHFCEIWFHETKPLIERDYIETGKVNLIFVDMAFLGRDSPKAAQATYCAEDQGMYWQYHDMLYNSQEPKIDGGWANTERLKAFAFALGLDMDLFNSCLDSGKYSKRVQYNVQQARENGINSTPGFFVVGSDTQHFIKGAQPYSTFQQVIESMI
ncbi:DsbA family protein [Nitrosopumilus sp.]|uniref:DsbA family protein n=1 Tax=Nitrosopumilus sp. TaxID=2024843 RepID=UPI002636F898|nr:DsbA family protein [Nitrosopumilus sp.]